MQSPPNLMNTSYYSLIPQDWISDGSFNTVVLRCYSSSVSGSTDHSEFIYEALDALKPILAGRFYVACAKTEMAETHISAKAHLMFHDGNPIMHTELGQTTLKPGEYIFLLLPLEVQGGAQNEEYIIRRTEFTRGIFTALFGHTGMLELMFEQRYELDKPDQVSSVSPVVENHILPDHWRAFNKESLMTLKENAINLEHDLKNRFESSLSFIGRTVNELDSVIRFSHIWIALEIAGGGNKGAKDFLNGLHDNFAHEAKRFIDMRNALFHHGQRPAFDQADERFLCACVMALNLKNVGIADPKFAALVVEQSIAHPKP